jgi:hypothetical protein
MFFWAGGQTIELRTDKTDITGEDGSYVSFVSGQSVKFTLKICFLILVHY